MNATCPRHIVFESRGLNYAGPGRAPGSHNFVDPGRGEVAELFFGQVIQVGNLFGLCRLANNSAMPSVRVDHALLNGSGPLQLGQVLLLGPLAFDKAGPRARAAWPVAAKRDPQPFVVTKLGTMWVLKPGYGFIKPADGTSDVFFHFSQCQGFAPAVGLTVKYTPAANPRGPQAIGIRRA